MHFSLSMTYSVFKSSHFSNFICSTFTKKSLLIILWEIFGLLNFNRFFLLTLITDAPNSYTYSHQHLLGNKIDHACTNFTFGSMEFYSPNYPEKYTNNLECIRAIEGELNGGKVYMVLVKRYTSVC